MTAISGRDIGPVLCKALGIDINGTRRIDIHVAADSPVTIVVERLMQDCQTKQFGSAFERYELVEKAIPTAEHNGQPAPVCPQCLHAYPPGDDHHCNA